jgi:molybdopterin-guanine dinucleotide biosynthesis protein B
MNKPKVLQIIGQSGSGKTTLIQSLLMKLSEENYSCTSIKSARTHTYNLTDKDSDIFLKAGSNISAVVFENKTQIMINEQVSLDKLIEEFTSRTNSDFIIVEGFKKENYPKLLIWTEGSFDETIDFSTIKFLYINSKDYDDNRQIIDEFVNKYNILFSTDINEAIQNILKYFIS